MGNGKYRDVLLKPTPTLKASRNRVGCGRAGFPTPTPMSFTTYITKGKCQPTVQVMRRPRDEQAPQRSCLFLGLCGLEDRMEEE